ncbi:flagellin [Salipiger bermudensis]|uniref:flagellin N-terminal helical domain-containing protein n=1 Tax=Salipiger bermudensis TaxID=344736 RepID=UPI001CD1D806|nr:flagellin [Salipiger bermudensis]MCA0964123.1 flagellar protein [Salipiger bermudensis]
MSSINTNASAMNALSTLRQINSNLESTQGRISTGLKVESGKDNAAYFQISETMKGDSSVYASINEGLTLTKNSVSTARLGAETINGLAQQFLDKVAFAQGATGGHAEIESDLAELVKQMETTLSQSTFNGDDMLGAGSYTDIVAGTGGSTNAVAGVDGAMATAAVNGAATVGADREVVTGISRAGTYKTTSITVGTHDMASLVASFKAIVEVAGTTNGGTAVDGFGETAAAADATDNFLATALATSEDLVGQVTDIATKLGQSEKSIENQQEFLSSVVDNIDAGVGSMIDANMEEEAARLQALQVQQQLATQSLSIANQAPQNILSLFR